MHILNGFRDKGLKPHSSGEKSVEFVSSSTATQPRASRRQSMKSGASSKQITAPTWAKDDEGAWLSGVWDELLGSDFGYCKMALSEVLLADCVLLHAYPLRTDLVQIYTIFKRRHQLKSTALELTDINGVSMLFSFESIEVGHFSFSLINTFVLNPSLVVIRTATMH